MLRVETMSLSGDSRSTRGLELEAVLVIIPNNSPFQSGQRCVCSWLYDNTPFATGKPEIRCQKAQKEKLNFVNQNLVAPIFSHSN